MPTNFTTLRPLVLAKLQTLIGSGLPLKAAFDKHTENTTGYPYATFEPSGLANQYFTTTDNLREYAFDIFIFNELAAGGRDNAIDKLCVAVDATVNAFDSDTTLRIAGGCHYVKALPAEWGEFIGQKGPIKYAKLTLVCGVEVAV